MRKLMWFTVGFAAACAAGVYWGLDILLFVCSAVLAVGLMFIKRPLCAVAAAIFVGAAIGALWTGGYNTFYLKTAKQFDGTTTTSVAEITDYSYDTDYGVAADCKVALGEKTYRARLYLEDGKPLSPGDQVKGRFRFRMTTADATQGETHHQGEGIFLLIYAEKECTVAKAEKIQVKYLPAKLRKDISQMLETVFPEETVPFINALMLGDSSMLDYATDTDFKLSGIRHIIAVSGLHVSILMSCVYLFFSRRRIISAVIGIPVLILFAAVVGFTPSVTRACIMQILILLGLAILEEYDPPTALATAVLIMLAINPWTIASVSFQLSTGCMIGIFLFYDRIYGFFVRKLKLGKIKSRKDKILYSICSGTAITLSTTIVTTPLSAVYFGAISLMSVLTNLLTLWVISFIFGGAMLCCIAGMVWLPLAKVMALVVSVPIRYVMLIASGLGSFSYSAVYTCSVYIVVWIIMCYLLFGAFLLCKRKRPVLLLGSASIGLILALFLSWVEPMKDNYRITFFDVGQGQSILIECDNRKYLIDCGGDSDVLAADTVVQHLRSRSVTALDGIIVTHYDRDHSGGVTNVLSEISVNALYLPDASDDRGIQTGLTSAQNKATVVNTYTEIATEKMKLSLIPGKEDAPDNERSMCVLFQTENCAILITGDRNTAGERTLLETVQLPQVDILVAGHHGAGSSTGMELLEVVRPKIVVFSLAENNFYGHPSDQVLYRLGLFKCKIYRTDRDGTIVFKG